MSTFGSWTGPTDVNARLVAHGLKWITEFLAEIERQKGLDPRDLPVPGEGQWTVSRDEFEKWPEDQTPAVFVITPGLTGTPRQEGDGSLTAPVAFSVAVQTSSGGHGKDASDELAHFYGTALKQLYLAPLPIEGLRLGGPVTLIDERYDDIPFIKRRDLGSARLIFSLWVRDWVTHGRPPRKEPREDPYQDPGNRPRVATTNLELRGRGDQ